MAKIYDLTNAMRWHHEKDGDQRRMWQDTARFRIGHGIIVGGFPIVKPDGTIHHLGFYLNTWRLDNDGVFRWGRLRPYYGVGPQIGTLGPHAVYVDNTEHTIEVGSIAFIGSVDSNPDKITDSGNGFVAAGLKDGMTLAVTGSVHNDGTYVVDVVTTGTLTLDVDDELTSEEAGATVKIVGNGIIYHVGTAEADSTNLYKINSRGNPIKDYAIAGGQQLHSVHVDSSGNIYVGGDPAVPPLGKTMRKLDSDGNVLWSYDTNARRVNDITVDAAGNVYLAVSDPRIVWKLNSAGFFQWHFIPGAPDDNGQRVAIDAAGNVYITVAAIAANGFFKINNLGVLQWGFASSEAVGIDVDAAGNVYVAGEMFANGGVIKTNSLGAEQWRYDARVGGVAPAMGTLKLDSNDNLNIAGRSATLGDPCIWQIDSDGNLLWEQATGQDANDVALDSQDNLYVVGSGVNPL